MIGLIYFHPRGLIITTFHVHLIEAYPQGKNSIVDIFKKIRVCKTGSEH
jgi:hypothetical protein